MGEISPDWRQKIKETLKKCYDIFCSQQSLYQLFGADELYAWQEYLPEATSVGQRIDNTLYYLSDKENALGQNALVLFLQVLSRRYPPPDERYYLLASHMLDLQTKRSHIGEKRSQETFAKAASQQSMLLTISEMESIRHRALSVALIKTRRFLNGMVEYDETGTGWLIAPGLLLTCWHVVATLMDSNETPPEATDMQRQLEDMLIFFGKTESTGGGIDYRIEKLEYSAPQQDVAILRLADRKHTPYTEFGYLSIELDPPLTTQTQLFIIQHPWGEPQQVAIGGSFIGHTELPGRICYTTDTQPGTSGAPVLRRLNSCVVAIHNGKVGEESVLPEGTRIDAILDTLQEQVPKLHHEIMQAQEKLNDASIQAKPIKRPVVVASSAQKRSGSSFSPGTSPIHDGRRYSQLNQEPDSRVQGYTYLTTYVSAAPILCLAFDPLGESLLYGAVADGINKVDIATLRLTSSTLKTYTKAVTSLAFSSNGKYLGSGGDDGTVILWDFAQQSRYKTFQAHTDWVSCLVFRGNGRHLLSGSDDGSIKILEVSTKSSRYLKEPTEIYALTSHPQQELIASCSRDQNPIIWSITPDSNTNSLELSGPATSLLFSPDGHYLVSGVVGGSLVIYDTQTWAAASLPARHTQAIHCLAFHPEGSLLVSGGDSQMIELWDIPAGKHVQTLPGHTSRITSLAFSPDGHLLASAGQDAKIIVWKSL